MADVNANNLPVAHMQNSQSMTMSITLSLVELAVLRERSSVVDTFFSAKPVNNIDDVISEDGLMITFPFTMSNIVTPEMGKRIIQLLAKCFYTKLYKEACTAFTALAYINPNYIIRVTNFLNLPCDILIDLTIGATSPRRCFTATFSALYDRSTRAAALYIAVASLSNQVRNKLDCALRERRVDLSHMDVTELYNIIDTLFHQFWKDSNNLGFTTGETHRQHFRLYFYCEMCHIKRYKSYMIDEDIHKASHTIVLQCCLIEIHKKLECLLSYKTFSRCPYCATKLENGNPIMEDCTNIVLREKIRTGSRFYYTDNSVLDDHISELQ